MGDEDMQGKWVWLLKGNMRDPCGVETILYPDYCGGYRNYKGDNIV